ncbi:MAG: hypothetical protein K2I81_02285 [Alphaproteobacteria bacterium]|nr:hypothetical protein [Alphaproteobacteria bacterium]
MPQQNNNRLLSWLVTRPIMFAIIAFVAIIAATTIAGLVGSRLAAPIANILVVIAFLGASAWLVRKLPGTNLNRRDFIAISNAQMFITSIAFITSTLLIIHNAQTLMLRMLWLESQSSMSFVVLIAAISLFYLYLCGIFVANLYAKYRRIRAMGVGMWKTLATAPFGFAMLWIPGYLMDDTETKNTPERRGWYNRLTDWIVARNYRAAGILVLLIMMAGFTFGYPALLLTLGLGVLFAVWTQIVGIKRMRQNIGGAYATTAIVINILAIISICGYAAMVRHTPKATFETPEMVQYIEGTQQQ